MYRIKHERPFLTFLTLLAFILSGVVLAPVLGQDCPVWEQRENPPGPISLHAMAFDTERGVVVLHGGKHGTTSTPATYMSGNTYEWNGIRWVLRSMSGPYPQSGHAMAYDSGRHVTVLFGKVDPYGLSVDTWEWDGSSWVPRLVEQSPPTMTAHSLAYDSDRAVTVLVGLPANATQLEVWEWDGSTWLRRTESAPPARRYAGLTYDPDRHVTLLFGGFDPQGGPLGDAWSWNGIEWVLLSEIGPSPRGMAPLAFDIERRRVLLFGGSYCVGSYCEGFGDTWSWDGQAWTQLTGNGPQPRAMHATAYDSSRRNLVCYGGASAAGFNYGMLRDETWGLSLNGWSKLREQSESRTDAKIVSTSPIGRPLMYGGAESSGSGSRPSALLEWDGNRWNKIIGGDLPGRTNHAMSFDPVRGVVVVFGGITAGFVTNETWEWDGSSWSLRSTKGPDPRPNAALTYDSKRDITVLFGGGAGAVVYGDTWEWDGTSWTLRATSGPSPRTHTAMTFDEARGVTLLHGGDAGEYTSASLDDFWQWDGQEWTSIVSATRIARSRHTLAYDRTRSLTLMFGGESPARPPYPGDLWEWDGTEWRQSGPFSSFPQGATWAGLGVTGCFDPERRSLLIYALGSTSEYLSCSAVDSDGDDLFDADDDCPKSELGETAVIDGCDTGVSNHLFPDGCTMMDHIAECAESASQHRDFVRCVDELTDAWQDELLIDRREKRSIHRCAAKADLPPQTKPDHHRGAVGSARD